MDTIEHNGVSVSIKETGFGEPIVFLHSSASSNNQWRAAFETWSDQFHLVAPNLYAAGETGKWPGRKSPSLAHEVALVNRVVSKLNRPVHIIGHSYGGAVALHMALQNPDCIQSLCLIEPVAFNVLREGTSNERALYNEVLSLAENIEQAVKGGLPQLAAQHFVDYWNGEGTWQRLDCAQRTKLFLKAKMLPGNFHATLREPTQISAYGRINVPTLIVCGTQSPKPTRHITRMLTEAIAGARHRTIAGAGHMLPVTHPLKVNAAIGEHLLRVRQSSLQQAA